MKALRIRPWEAPELVDLPIKTPEDELRALQDEIGGYLEIVRTGPGTALVVDEEGLLKELELNFTASSLVGTTIVGPALLIGMAPSPDGDICADLPEAAQEAAKALWEIIYREYDTDEQEEKVE